MRGTWQGSGTWQTSGTGAGAAVALVALAAAAVVVIEVVVADIWWIIAAAVMIAVTAVAAALWLARWNDRRAARAWARRPAQLRAEPVRELPRQRSAITPQVVNFNFYGADAARAAAVIRQAIPGPSGDAGTREE